MGVEYNNGDEKLVATVESQPSIQNGYFLSVRQILLCCIIVVMLCIIVGLMSAYLGPGRKAYHGDDGEISFIFYSIYIFYDYYHHRFVTISKVGVK